MPREEDMLFVGGLVAKGFIHDKRLFFWAGNDVLRLLVLPLLLVLFDNGREGDLC
jgi:hypothetical protein